MKHALAATRIFAIIALAGHANAAPICQPDKWVSRAELYPKSDLFIDMPIAELEKLAGQDHARALNALGVKYGTGRGVAKDSKKSFEYYLRASMLGLPRAQANLAFMYYRGEGTKRDWALAWQWALKSARAGHMAGQATAGHMLGMGEGVKMDRREAAYCYLLAARQGDGDAQDVMVTIYRDGLGILKDAREAALWQERSRQSHETDQPWFDDSPLNGMPAAWGKAD
jgi:TPR repeat protein